MLVDLSVIVVFLASLWIGWSTRISINWLRFLWIILFATGVAAVFPYFISFVRNSSTDFPIYSYYVFGILVIGMIFLCFYLLLRTKRAPSSGVRRLAGSLVLGLVSVYSLLVVLVSIADYQWIDAKNSIILSKLPEWILKPFN